MLEHIPGLPDLILFWMNDVSVIRVSRCGITRGTLSGKHVLTLIWMIMTGGSFKIVSNWAVLTAYTCALKIILHRTQSSVAACFFFVPSSSLSHTGRACKSLMQDGSPAEPQIANGILL